MHKREITLILETEISLRQMYFFKCCQLRQLYFKTKKLNTVLLKHKTKANHETLTI